MEVKVILRKLQVSPTKVQLVIDAVRGLDIMQAEKQLMFMKKGSAPAILKLLKSAAANAENNFRMNRANLFVKEIFVTEGFRLHRWKPKAMGRATPIQKKSSIVTLIVGEKAKEARAKTVQKKKDLPTKKAAK